MGALKVKVNGVWETIKGIPGPVGPRGPEGPQGPQGDPAPMDDVKKWSFILGGAS